MKLCNLFLMTLLPAYACTVSLAEAALVPDRLFGPHAVLQAGCPVPVWGKAKPGDKIRVHFNRAGTEGICDPNGSWRLVLPPLNVGETGELVFEAGDEKVVSADVVVGNVWLCAGQSNIEWTIYKSANAEAEIAAANYPLIRQFRVTPSSVPLASEKRGEWVVCTPKTVWSFTAIGYFLARDLYSLGGEPQGLVNCSWGGTEIETWMSPEAIASCKEGAAVADFWKKTCEDYPAAKAEFERNLAIWTEQQKAAEGAGTPFTKRKPYPPRGPGDRNEPSVCYEAMMKPLIPGAIRAAIWYQGEGNARNPGQYQGLLEGLIRDWRLKWNSNLPVIIVQLPGIENDGVKFPFIREAQAKAAESLDAGLVVTLDISKKEIHPTNKQEFAQRLGLAVRSYIFGEKIATTGPKIIAATPEHGAMRVKLEGALPVLRERENPGRPGAFELAGADHKFYAAKAVLDHNDILVQSESVPEPVALRYAWRDSADPILFDSKGLPAAPFRTDDWTDFK